ncbi:carbohydrate-binding protein [Hymenobacter sp.]|uniref:carbohydrate-binding protein n=1 Tax=Hymenobacter sp. TaxID=1898978 RepID=UPI00286D2EBB|nr:carbohydrate-binding protein [Hymenobacter sp.]
MKAFYTCGLGAALLLPGLNAQAQDQRLAGPAYPLGTSQALVQQFEAQAAKSTAQRTAPTVTLRVSATQAFAGRVNYREDLSATGEYVIGEIQGVAGSSFMVRIEGPRVEGHIILRATKQAYRYSADARGNVIVQEVDINKVICVDLPVGYQAPAPAKDAASRAAVVLLQSFPGAKGCIMLDFDGQYVAGTLWNNGNPINAAPSPLDDAGIREFWEIVSEDFRPFNLNVTTDEAVFNTYPKTLRRRCIVTPTNTAAPGAGGVAYVGSFRRNDDLPCWVFQGGGKFGGEAASHEMGHTLGLSHDGRNNPAQSYYSGQDHIAWAPIMGTGYSKPVTQWSRGEYNRANNLEDDLAIMSGPTYNLGYRNDDHSNAIAGATALARTGNSVSGGGLIERTLDQDYFAFTTGGGAVSLNVNTVGRHGNLDIVARLFDGGGALIGTFDTPGGGQLNVALNASLGAGTYYLQIDGTSAGNPATDGYSDYGSLGTFSISGTAPTGTTPPPAPTVATLYKDCPFAGAATALPVGDYTLAALQARGILNEDLSSVRINGGYQVVLFENDNFGGASLTLTSENSCLTGNALGTGSWNDKVSSLRVQPASSVASQLIQAESHSVNNGMVVEGCADAGGGQNMGYVDAGDYLVFNGINFPTSGTYTLEYRVASLSGGTVSSDLSAGSVQFGNTAIPATGGWQNWTTVSKSVTVNAGTYNFGVYAQTGGWNLNWVRISKTSGRAALAASNEPQAPDKLALYPNPVATRLSLTVAPEFGGGQVRILNFNGLEVWHGTYNGAAVDVAGLKPGLYTLVVSNAGRKLVSRFSKE